MEKYFFGNTLAAFFRSSVLVVEATTAATFDEDFVDNSISIPNGTFIESMPFIDAVSTTALWLHLECNGAGSSVTGEWITFYNLSGVKVGYIQSDGGGASTNVRLYIWDGATFVVQGAAIPRPGALNRWDIQLICGVSGAFAIYTGGTLLTSGALAEADFNNIAKVRVQYNQGCHVSQFLCCDTDTRDQRYMQKLADADGNYTDGTGGFADINETILDEGTSITLPDVGDKATFTKPAIAVPVGYEIAAMCVAARGRIGGTPTDAEFLIRSDGVDSNSSGAGFNGGYEPRGHCLEIDPATAAQFDEAGFNAAEFGLEAV